MPIISVIIPCYNVEKLIARCLESLERQTIGFEKLELILVDDCSVDNTLEILKSWEAKYPENTIVVECSENGRQGRARNIGIQYATTDWLGFVDSDDWVEPDYFECLYFYAADQKYELVCCGNIRDKSKKLTFISSEMKNRGVPKEIIIDSEEKRRLEIRRPSIEYSAWGKLISKDFLVSNSLFFAENLTYEDAGWGSLLILCFERALILPDELYHYYVNDTSTVLAKNSNHHLDCITIQTIVWNEYERRGFLEKYREELEIEHIYSAYLAGLKFAIYRYEVPDYNVYLLLRTLIIERIPDYSANKYIRSGELDEKYMLMLTALDCTLNKKQFMEFAENIKKIGI